VNADNEMLLEMSDGMDRLLYGRNNLDLFASGTLSSETPFLEFDWNFFEHPHHVKPIWWASTTSIMHLRQWPSASISASMPTASAMLSKPISRK